MSEVNTGLAIPEAMPLHLVPEFQSMGFASEEAAITAGLRYANDLDTKGKKEIQDHIIVGEEEAVDATLATILEGGNILYLSLHGGGKTILLRDSHRVIDGITNVATVEPRADLTGAEFSGVTMPLRQVDKDKGGHELSSREIWNIVKGTVNKDTQVINWNELFRTSPYIQNAGLEVMASRVLETPQGLMRLKALEFTNATVNPFSKGSRGNQFRPHTANLSRFHTGVTMGDEKSWEDVTRAITFGRFVPTPERINPAIKLAELHLARMAMHRGLIMPQSVGEHMMRVSMAGSRVLTQELGAEELPGRINVHILHSALARTALKGEKSVSVDDVNKALEGKIGPIMAGLRPDSPDEIKQVYKKIIEAAGSVKLKSN